MLATSLFIWVMRSDYHKSRIRSYLESAGASDIDVSQRLFDFDQGNNTFEVNYTDRNGVPRQSTCKLSSNLFSSGEMYWTDMP